MLPLLGYPVPAGLPVRGAALEAILGRLGLHAAIQASAVSGFAPSPMRLPRTGCSTRLVDALGSRPAGHGGKSGVRGVT
jgi:hypothetical protein